MKEEGRKEGRRKEGKKERRKEKKRERGKERREKGRKREGGKDISPCSFIFVRIPPEGNSYYSENIWKM